MGTYTFLSRKKTIVLYITRGGRGSPKPMQLGLTEGIYLVE